MLRARGENREVLDIRRHEYVIDREAAVGEELEQPGFGGRTQDVRYVWMSNVAVDQDHRRVVFHSDTHREVDGGVRLAFARQRTGHHHEVTVADFRRPERIAHDRPLDDAELVGERRLRCVRSEEGLAFQRSEVDLEAGSRRLRERHPSL